MPAIIPIVEGDGDVEAVPRLVERLLQDYQCWDWSVGHPKRAGSIVAFSQNLSRFLNYAQSEKDCGAILVLLDLDDGCPLIEARKLAEQIRSLHLLHPVGVVLARREYEAWFLASLPTVRGKYDLPPDLVYVGDVEERRGAKEWLTKQMPTGKAYKETIHQAKLTHRINLDLARQHSRSFRRLYHAIEELTRVENREQRGLVTPF